MDFKVTSEPIENRQLAIKIEVAKARVDAELRKTIQFLDDPDIPRTIIHETCERCPLRPEQCAVRAAPPTILNARREQLARKMALSQLKVHHNRAD